MKLYQKVLHKPISSYSRSLVFRFRGNLVISILACTTTDTTFFIPRLIKPKPEAAI